MPIQKESQAAGLPPMINLGLSAEDAPHTQIYETNPIYTAPDLWRTKKCETNPIRVHQVSNHTPNTRNEPNLTNPTAKKSETNPIYPYPSLAQDPNMRNEPNPPCPLVPHAPIMRNEPNSRRNPQSTFYNLQ